MKKMNKNIDTPNMDQFVRLTLKEVAASMGISDESISRDDLQGNYSLCRLRLTEMFRMEEATKKHLKSIIVD